MTAHTARRRQPPKGTPIKARIIILALVLVLLAFLLPALLSRNEETGGGAEQPAATLPDSGHTLNIWVDGTIQELDVNDYIWGVVAAEMPASFEEEALKAQAVAARTYSLNKRGVNSDRHPGADLCTDYRCCQAWISREEAQANWGENASLYTDKITRAVADTNNQVLLYNGQLIDAVFHSSSAAATEDAVEVWGNSVPYLQSVQSPEGEDVPNYHSSVSFDAETFRSIFLGAHPEAVLDGSPTGWFSQPELTARGSVRTITIGGVPVSGMEARTLFSLRSTVFSVAPTEEEVFFEVTGYGHGVGMSQYGANTLAAQGKIYPEILAWYYTGVTVEPCPDWVWGTQSAS